MTYRAITFLAVFFCIIPSILSAKNQFEITPTISISELYDDNINLSNNDLKADWITTLSPNINVNIRSEKNKFLFSYTPAFVRYKNRNQSNTINHFGMIEFNGNLTSRLRFFLEDNYRVSDDPIEQTAGLYDTRHNRESYQRNIGEANMTLFLGPEDTFKLSYNHDTLNNKDISLIDKTYSNPSAALKYWFNKKNNVELDYGYISTKFTNTNKLNLANNYYGNTVDMKYSYSFDPVTMAFFDYNLNTRSFVNSSANYDIHHGYIGFSHAFSNVASVSLSAGYFQLKSVSSNDDNGYSYDLSLIKNFNSVGVSISGSEGWREGYMESDTMGLLKYRLVNSKLDYQVLERLSNYAGFTYMQSKEETGLRKFKSYNVNYGWTLSFFKWYSLSIDYSRTKRDDSVDTYNYIDNRVMMILMVGKVTK
jgi:hypothetical protein